MFNLHSVCAYLQCKTQMIKIAWVEVPDRLGIENQICFIYEMCFKIKLNLLETERMETIFV